MGYLGQIRYNFQYKNKRTPFPLALGVAAVLVFLIIFGCIANTQNQPNPGPSMNDEPNSEPNNPPSVNSPVSLAGSWRIYPLRLNIEGGVDYRVLSSRKLELHEDGSWDFGSSHGTWKSQTITEADWQKWSTEKYGPTKKIVLDGWEGKVVDGPVDEENGAVNFFWLIYDVKNSYDKTVQLQLKFGH
ncbi:hypothetical protein HY988_03420 [Candidatus Micrarchaeota archaeon]|nr:hypothetical protein [Candidatus Micrarchaeota archaeon]